jgi:hypothetical protein
MKITDVLVLMVRKLLDNNEGTSKLDLSVEIVKNIMKELDKRGFLDSDWWSEEVEA